MKLHGILSIGVVLAVIHVAHSRNCMFHGGRTYLYDDMARNVNDFSTNLYQAVLNDPSVEKNFISSPLSVAMVLLMTGFGARGSTAAELNRFLHSESLNECTVRTMTAELSSYKNVELSLANNIFADISLNINPEFQVSVKFASIFGIERVDFAQSHAVRKINDWCERKTNSRIQELLKPDDVGADTKLVLVNAIYFKGKWAQPFDKSLTEPRPFKLANGQVKNVPTMYARNNKYYHGSLPELSAKFIELPYESKNRRDKVSMFIILPDEHDGLSKVENGIRGVPLETLRSGAMEKVDLFMPLFKIESKVELTDILQSMGMEEIFSDGADFSGISEDANLEVSKIVQKAFIEVNEEGSEAAAATAAVFMFRSSVRRPIFIVDRPFLVLIATEDVILFSGRVTDPHQ